MCDAIRILQVKFKRFELNFSQSSAQQYYGWWEFN